MYSASVLAKMYGSIWSEAVMTKLATDSRSLLSGTGTGTCINTLVYYRVALVCTCTYVRDSAIYGRFTQKTLAFVTLTA